jgi:hypothetical protein
MYRSHLALAATFAIAAFEVGASVRLELPEAALKTCQSRLQEILVAEGHTGSHPFDLNKHCPELAASLDDADTRVVDLDATSVEGLRDLRSFTAGFDLEPRTPENFYLDLDRVDALLAEVLVEEGVDDTLWDRFLRWLEQYVKEGESSGFDRFVDWLEGLDAPPWLGDVIIKVSVVLIVLLALLVVGNELRLSGLLRRVRHKREPKVPVAAADAVQRTRTLTLDELRGLPPRQLAAGILEVVTATLAERGWLSSSSSLTNGELVRQIGQRRSALAGSFTSLVRNIEKIIYGDRQPDDETREQLVATARELMDSTHHGPAAASEGSR